MIKKFYISILFVLMIFTLSVPAISGGLPTFINGSFDYWNAGPPDNWTVSVEIYAYSHTGSNKIDGNASLYASTASLNSEEIYQAAGELSASTTYYVSASVKDSTGGSHAKLCIDQTGGWTASTTTCSSDSTDTNSFATLVVSALTDGSGNLGYIFFQFNQPGALSAFNQKPSGVSVTIDIYIDNVVISTVPPVNEFSGTLPVIVLSLSIFVVSILVYKKRKM